MKRERRNYDKEFKLMAVNLCLTGKSAREVSEELGVRSEIIRRWVKEYEKKEEQSFPGKGKVNLNPEQAEIIRLKKELKEAQIERDILKKAVSIFSKNDGKFSNS